MLLPLVVLEVAVFGLSRGLKTLNPCNLLLYHFLTGAVAYPDAFFGQGFGPIYFDDFLCVGTESNLLNCTNGGLNSIDGCRGHLDDAGVRCAQGML